MAAQDKKLVAETREGNLRVTYWDIFGPNPYALDGQSVTAAELGLGAIVNASVGGSDNGDQFCAAVVQGDSQRPGNSFKVQWYVMSTGAEVAAGVDLSARRVRARVVSLN